MPDLYEKTLWQSQNTQIGSSSLGNLPNIKGYFTFSPNTIYSAGYSFYIEQATGTSPFPSQGAQPMYNLIFNANSYNSIYGDNVDKVIPSCLCLYFCIKY